jgi:hypothetical protein
MSDRGTRYTYDLDPKEPSTWGGDENEICVLLGKDLN